MSNDDLENVVVDEGVDTESPQDAEEKTLDNVDSESAQENVSDIEFVGNPDAWVLVSKAWSNNENWMKSTKAMNVPNGVLVQVTTQQGDNVAEALSFVPGINYVASQKIFKKL